MLLVKPVINGDERVMVCAAAATIEPSSGEFIFVNIPKNGWASSDAAFGTVEADNSSGWTFDVTNFLITGEPRDNNSPSGTFVWSPATGTITDEGGADHTSIFMTPSGLFFGDSGPTKGGFVGVSYEGISISAIIPHQYRGIRFIYYPGTPSTGETEAVQCHQNGTSTTELWAQSYDNINTGSTHQGAGSVTITFEASTVPGFSRGYVHGFDEVGNHSEIIQCAVSRVGPDANGHLRYLLFGIGLDDSGRVFNFLFIQTDV
jgi:hypothetical protein